MITVQQCTKNSANMTGSTYTFQYEWSTDGLSWTSATTTKTFAAAPPDCDATICPKK